MGWDQTLNDAQIKVIRDILIDFQRVDKFSFPDTSYMITQSYIYS